MQPVETKHIGNLRIDIIPDDSSPWTLEECVEFGNVTYKRGGSYTLGNQPVSFEEMEELRDDPDNIWLPVYAYIHSGITISTGPFNCRWDSGQSGIVYCTHAEYRERKGLPANAPLIEEHLAEAREWLSGTVESLDRYLRNDFYGYVITDEDADQQLDSCWGFDDEKYCMDEATAQAEWYVNKKKKEGMSHV